ncbi:PAS domain S-box protein [Noviluteimonas dokdonensis]|nr:PAS domain S-box protein [Lysobacter dokdonensis]
MHEPEAERRAGEGDWLRRVHAFDWASTPLGPLTNWPHALRTALQLHETEIDHLRRLQKLSTRLVRDDEDEEQLLQDVVAAAVAVTGAQSGDLRMVREDGDLDLIVSHGLEHSFDDFQRVAEAGALAEECARTARRMMVDDVALSPYFDPDTRAALVMGGLRAIQAAPLLARDGRVLGVLTTHHPDGVPGERDLLLLDLLSRQAADWIERAHAVDKLEDSERRLHTILHQSVAGIMVADADGRVIYANRCWCRMLGYREDELLGKHLADITDPESLERSMDALRRLEGGMPSLTVEKRYRRKDGEPLWGSASVSALRGPDGRYEGFVAVIIDIGEHKRLERSLRDQADRLELALATGRLGTWHLDLITLETQASDQCKANFGVQPHETLTFQRAFDELIHPEDRDAMRQALAETIAAHTDYDADFRVVWPDGSVHWIVSRGRAVYNAEGRAVAMTGVNFDDSERRGAMERLRENEAQLRRTVEDAPLALCLHADDGEILNLSRHWTELTGYTKTDSAVLQDWLRRAYGIREGEFRDAIERIFGSDHAMVQTDIEIVTRNGLPRTWSMNASSPGRLKDGRRYVVAMALDITERKRAEALMRRSAARAAFRVSLSDLLRPLSDPVEIQCTAATALCEHLGADRTLYAEMSEDGHILHVHTDHCREGMSSVNGEHELATFGEEIGQRLRAGRTVVLDDAHASSTLAQAQRDAYERVQVRAHVSVPLVKHGRLSALLSVQQATPRLWAGDEIALIEETAERTWAAIARARAEAAVRESESRLEAELADAKLLQEISAELVHEESEDALYDNLVAAAMAIMRSQFAVLQRLHPERGNGGQLELLASRGFTPQSAIEWTWIDAGPASQSCSAQAMRAEGRMIIENIERHDTMAGSADQDRYRRTGIAAVQSTPLFARDGQIVGMLSTHWTRPHMPAERDLRLLDILARQAADLIERRQGLEDLRAADRRKDEFLATLAHELRNPLAPLRNCLHILRATEGDDAQLHKLHGMMERQVQHMIRLVDDLMEVSRITRGEIELRKQRVTMRDVLEGAIETSRPLLEQANHHFHVEAAPDALALDADPMRLAQVFTNLLNNAAKYTPPGGNITLLARRDGDVAEVRVRDDGIGLAPEMLTHVFDMFTQSEHGRAHSQGGLGIGLTLVKSLVEQHGGTVEARSAGLGQGSEFVVRLPLAPGALIEESGEWPVVRQRHAMSIVVADDNHESADSMALFLQMRGHEVRTVYDGRAALEAIAERRPDVVLLDLGMPTLDGFETCQQIRAMPEGDKIAVMATTGWGSDADRQRSAACGFDAHLVKPVDPGLLLARLDALH